jgi:hypothetical protein
MTIAALWISVAIGAPAVAEEPAKCPSVPVAGTVLDAERMQSEATR